MSRRHDPPDVAVHEFVQLLAGWVPDEELAAVRRTLGQGQAAAAAAAAVAMAAEHDVPLLAESIEIARSLTEEPGTLDGVQPVAQYPLLPFVFSEFDTDGGLEMQERDQAIAEAVQERSTQIAGVWRTWRFPLDDPSEPSETDGVNGAVDTDEPDRGHLVYVVQVSDGGVAPAVAGELQAALDGDAGVEVIALDTVPQPYQAAALEGSALLWSAPDDEPPFRIARVFDFAKPDTGPGFHPEHRVVTDPAERDRMLEYLTSGTLALHTTARTRDVLSPTAGEVVPTSFRTDGEWIWTDTVAYYLEQHGMAPDEDLVTHIDERLQAGDTDAETDQDTAVAAANFLLYPPPEHARQAAWISESDG
jgi:hypothetical protein